MLNQIFRKFILTTGLIFIKSLDSLSCTRIIVFSLTNMISEAPAKEFRVFI